MIQSPFFFAFRTKLLATAVSLTLPFVASCIIGLSGLGTPGKAAQDLREAPDQRPAVKSEQAAHARNVLTGERVNKPEAIFIAMDYLRRKGWLWKYESLKWYERVEWEANLRSGGTWCVTTSLRPARPGGHAIIRM